MCSSVKTKYYIETFLRALTAVVLTSVAITLLHLHQAQILCWTVGLSTTDHSIAFLGGRGKPGYVCENAVAAEYLYVRQPLGRPNLLLDHCKLPIATTTTCPNPVSAPRVSESFVHDARKPNRLPPLAKQLAPRARDWKSVPLPPLCVLWSRR